MAAFLLSVLGVVLSVVLLVLLVPVLVLSTQVLMAGRGGVPATLADSPTSRPRLAVLMPAHNEAAGIAPAITTVRGQLAAGDRLLVVADNCSDETARIAAESGAEVVQRFEALKRGKGYALDFGVRHLATDPPDVVVVVDADCRLAAGCLDTLARECLGAGRPTQALYMMHAAEGAGPTARLAALAWLVKNHVRPLGWARLGLPCQLMGTGMGFPWPQIARARLASGHIVEDMQLGLELAAAGIPPLFCPRAVVSSAFPADGAALASQRTRWEHGHLGLITSRGSRLLWQGIKGGDAALAAMALDLMVPPLASLAALIAVGLLLAALLAVLGGTLLPLLLALLASALFGSAVLLAWHGFGRQLVSLHELAAVPGYVLGKLPMYVRWFTRRQAEWVRTSRDKPNDDAAR